MFPRIADEYRALGEPTRGTAARSGAALLEVGRPPPPGLPADLLRSSVRASGVTVAPAHGLTLVGVDYPADDQLAARAEQTRALRGSAL